MSQYKKFKADKYLRIEKIGKDENLKKITKDWLWSADSKKYSYNFEWLGRPIIQYPQDIVSIQELIWNVKPDLIIETGIAHGGSIVFSASILAMLDYADAKNKNSNLNLLSPKRKVLGVDIDIREHNKKYLEDHFLSDRIEMFEGPSTDSEMIEKVISYSKNYEKIMVIMDSNHTHEHVLDELRLYSPLVSLGSYCIVLDTIIEDLQNDAFPDRDWGVGNNPKTAVHEFLLENKNFEIDESIHDKLLITAAPDGYLKKIR